MIEVLKAGERAISDYGDVAIHRTFAESNPRDPHAGGFGPLVSIAETYIAPASGFPMHGHRDMEIVSYMADGAMAHKDSLGNGSVIGTHEVQRMSAGTGIVHSEFNPSQSEPCRCLQIWILPDTASLTPSYEQKATSPHDGLAPIDVLIHQDVTIHTVRLARGASASHTLNAGRRAYIQVARGMLALNGIALAPGDGAAVEDETRLTLTATDAAAEALLFDLA
jgi:redox-sensitive bicupin YhaK (pirin superfamily)